jgi:hypothetical protein
MLCRTNISKQSRYRFSARQNPTLALQICQEDYLPEASRFAQLEELDWAFGTMGTQDKGKHLATLYLEDISDFIVECVDANFGFSRYAERLGRSANSLTSYKALQQEPTYIDSVLLSTLKEKSKQFNLLCFNIGALWGIYIVLFDLRKKKNIILKLKFLWAAVSEYNFDHFRRSCFELITLIL